MISKLLPPEVAHFNPLPPHGGRPVSPVKIPTKTSFQSTPSTRRETQHPDIPDAEDTISIHSLHTEGDGTGTPGIYQI